MKISSYGEQSLAKNLDEIIEDIRELIDLPLVILTNSSTPSLGKMRRTLMGLDIVVTKLDVHDDSLFKEINRPIRGLHAKDIIKGIKKFRNSFEGRLELQTMFIEKK